MDRPLSPRVLSKKLCFAALCGLILGLLCVNSESSSVSSCDPRREFPCRTRPYICIPLSRVRDGRADCADASDEDECGEDQFQCKTGNQCLPLDRIRDGVSDCLDGSDEECPAGMHRCLCGTPKCISRTFVNDGVRHCQDGSDEGEDSGNFLCPESSGLENPFSVEMRKRKRRQTGPRRDPVVYPTGIVSAFIGTEVNGDVTTLHTTQLYRTYIDGTYTELLQSSSAIMATPTMESATMQTTANVQHFGSLNSGKVYLTAVNQPMSSISTSTFKATADESPEMILPTFSRSGQESTDHYETKFEPPSDDDDVIVMIDRDDESQPKPDAPKIHHSSVPTTRPLAITRYIQPTAYPNTGEPVMAYAGGNTVGVIGNIRKPEHPSALRNEPGYYRQGRMHNPGAATGRRIEPHVGATIITDQFFFPGFKSQASASSNDYDVDNAYYELDSLYNKNDEVKEQLHKIVRPTTVYNHRPTFKDKRLTRTVGLYGPIYEVDDMDKNTDSGRAGSESTSIASDMNEGIDVTTTLFGFAEFSTRISGTQYIFLPASTIPRTFTPRVTRTSFSNGISVDLRNNRNDGMVSEQPEAFFRKPLFGTETREFISQMSMFTSTVKEPVEIQKTMFTSTVMTKQVSDDRTRGRKIETESPIAMTLPLDLESVYVSATQRSRISDGIDISLSFAPVSNYKAIAENPIEPEASKVIDIIEESQDQPEPHNPVGVVSSITGTEVSDGSTTHWTTLILGTYIDNTYAHIIQSTSSIFYTLSKTRSPEETLMDDMTGGSDIYPSINNGPEIKSSISDVVDSSRQTNVKATDSLKSTSGLEILTSGFILPLSEGKVHAVADGSNFERTAKRILAPGVIYADLESTPSEVENNPVHIITDSFILPSFTANVISDSTEDSIMMMPVDTKSLDTESSHQGTNEETSDDTQPIVLLTGDFILPRAAMYDESSAQELASTRVLTDGFILPSRTTPGMETESSISDVMASNRPSILTDGFILPPETDNVELPFEGSSTVNMLPSSALLTAGFILPEDSVNDIDSNINGRSAGDIDKHVVPDEVVILSPSEIDTLKSKDDKILSSSNVIPMDKSSVFRSGKAVDETEDSVYKEIGPSVSFPVTYYTTSTQYTTFFVDGSSVISSQEETVSRVYSDSKELELARVIPTETTYFSETIQPTPTSDSNGDLATRIPDTTDYKDSSNLVSSRQESMATDLETAKTPAMEDDLKTNVLIFPTTLFTTLTYYTTLSKDGNTEVIASESVVSNIINPSEREETPQTHHIQPAAPRRVRPTTYYTTYTYYTTFHKDGTTSVSTRLNTISNIHEPSVAGEIQPTSTASETYQTAPSHNAESSNQKLTTFFTTFTYYTTYLKGGNTVVSSREETISNVSGYKTTTPSAEETIKRNEIEITKPLETTFFTTFTYYTTLLKEGTTTVSTRKEIVTNVVTGSKETSSVPTVSRTASPEDQLKPTPTVKTYFTTYTYYTTYLRDGSPLVSSRESTSTNVITENAPKSESFSTPTRTFATYFTTLSSFYTLYNLGSPSVSTVYSTLTDVVVLSTPTRIDSAFMTKAPLTPVISERDDTTSKIVSLYTALKPFTIAHAVTPFIGDHVQPTSVVTKTYYTTYTFFTTFLSKGSPTVSTKYETVTSYDTEQISKPTEEPFQSTKSIPNNQFTNVYSLKDSKNQNVILGSNSPITHYTTFSYYTTLLSGDSSVVQTRTRVISNVIDPSQTYGNREDFTYAPTILSTSASPTTPYTTLNTFYTTYTFFTTLFASGSPIVNSRLETLSNVVTMTISPTSTLQESKSTTDLEEAEGGFHENRVHPTPAVSYYTTQTYVSTTVKPDGGTSYITRKVIATAAIEPNDDGSIKLQPSSTYQTCCNENIQYPHTYYTTYTYFTTRYHGDRPIINTRYETITNVVKAPATDIIVPTEVFTKIEDHTPKPNFIKSNRNEDEIGDPDVKTKEEHREIYEGKTKPSNSNDLGSTRAPVKSEETTADPLIYSIGTTKNPSRKSEVEQETTTLGLTSDGVQTEDIKSVTTENSALNEVSDQGSSNDGLSSKTPLNSEKTLDSTDDAFNATETTTTEEVTTESTTSTAQSTTVAETPRPSVFGRRRNRPVYKPNPVFRAAPLVTTSTTTKSPIRTTTSRSSINRRNTTRLLFRRPTLGARINPLQRLRPGRRTPSPEADTTSSEDLSNRRKRSFFDHHPEVPQMPNRRRLLETMPEEYEEKVLKNNDLVSPYGDNSDNRDRQDRENNQHPLGLIRSVEAKAVNSGTTTVYATEIHGTFINGAYAQVVQSKVRFYSDEPKDIEITPTLALNLEARSTPESNKIGLISSHLSTVVKDGTSTVYTTNIYGTYVGDAYAHLAQVTSNIIRPTSVAQSTYPTGLISSIIRLEENDGTTTAWTSNIYGTSVNGYYAHVASSFSNVLPVSEKIAVQPTLLPSGFQNQLYSSVVPNINVSSAKPSQVTEKHKTGLLSSFVNNEVVSGTTTQYVTNIYGTYIGEHYAKHAQTVSRTIPFTQPESTSRSIGLVSSLVSSVVNDNIATIYKTEVYGTYIGSLYAQIARTTTEHQILPTKDAYKTSPHSSKTGLLFSKVLGSEIHFGTTTMHINEIYGTYIGDAYAHVAKSTSKIIKPTQQNEDKSSSETSRQTGLISSNIKTEVNDATTTLHTMEVYGTYVGNYYAHVAHRTSSVLPFVATTSAPEQIIKTENSQVEGLVTSSVSTKVSDGTTTLHVTEIYGTYINGWYAHIARKTSSVLTPAPTEVLSTSTETQSLGLVSVRTSSEINYGTLTLHTTEIYGTRINGFYAHIARSTSRVVVENEETDNPVGVVTATTATEVNMGTTTLRETSLIGAEIDGRYVQSLKITSSILPTSQFYSEAIRMTSEVVSPKYESPGVISDELDTARVNKLDDTNQYMSPIDSAFGRKIPYSFSTEYGLLSPSVNFNPNADTMIDTTPSLPDIRTTSNSKNTRYEGTRSTSRMQTYKESPTETESAVSSKPLKKEEKTSKSATDDYENYNDYFDSKTLKTKETPTPKPNTRKYKSPTVAPSRKFSPDEEYDDYGFEDDYDEFGGRKHHPKASPSVAASPRFKASRNEQNKNVRKSSLADYDDYEDYYYNESETSAIVPTKSSSTSTTKESSTSSVRIRPFTGRGRPTTITATTTEKSSSKPSFTIQFRRPTRTRNSRAFGQRSDSENDFDDEISDEDEEGDIEASEAVVTTATPQVLSNSRRKPFGSNRLHSRNQGQSSTTSKPLPAGRNRRPFGRSPTTSPSPTPSQKDSIPDYDENTTEDDEFDDYDDISDKKDDNRFRNFRSTRRPPSRQNRFGERRSASNKRGSFRHREEEETENDDFDVTTPNYRNNRNRGNQRKQSRNRQSRNNSPSLKPSFNSLNRDEDEDAQSLQPINRLRNNNRNRRPSYNPRTRRPSKTVTETETMKKPYLTVTSVITTVKTLPIYHGFRTSYATLTTTALDTSIINPTQYSEVISDGLTKTVFYSKVGYPDGLENYHTTITEVVVTTTSLASVKLVPIKIGFSTRTDTITDIQVLTTLSTVYSTITPDAPLQTAFPQQFQHNFYQQLGPPNPDYGLLASANSFVTTQVVTSTTVVPIILRGRTILSTLTTTSTAESTVVQTVRLPQVPSAGPFIPQQYFAFQPLTTLITLYVTGEYGELKPVVTTVTVPLYQQPVFHTKVARSLQSVSEQSLKTADIMNSPLKASIANHKSRDMDIDTHYDKLLSSGLEEINDLSEMRQSYIMTEPLEGSRLAATPIDAPTYDITTISRGPLTEIYEQRVTINIDGEQNSLKQNEIERNKDAYGLESRYSFRKLQQFEEDEQVFRPQRDFTRIRRPPGGIIRATVTEPRIPVTNEPVPRRFTSPRQPAPPVRRPPTTDETTEPFNRESPNGFRGTFARGPQRRPPSDFRPFIERPTQPISFDNEVPAAVPDKQPDDIDQLQGLISSLQNARRNLDNGFLSTPDVPEGGDGFRPLLSPPAVGGDFPENVRAPSRISDIPRRVRVTRPITRGDNSNSGLRRVTRVRSSIVVPESSPSFDNEIQPSADFSPSSALPTPSIDFNPSDSEVSSLPDDSPAYRRTVSRRLNPSFVPGDGRGERRPVVVRRTRISEHIPTRTQDQPFESPTIDIDSPTEIFDTPTSSARLPDIESNEDPNASSKPPVKKIIRLRKPENGDNTVPNPGQRRRVVISRKPQDGGVIASNVIQGRGPVSSGNIDGHNIIADNNLHPDKNLDVANSIPILPEFQDSKAVYSTKSFPFTYYTTLTYFTTFLHGPEVNYASREAVFSNVIDQTLNPSLENAIKSRNGRLSSSDDSNIVHLASRTLGDTTTIVNLASHQNIYNSEVFKLLNNEDRPIEASVVSVPTLRPLEEVKPSGITDIRILASLPKTYVTLFTYSYTFYDGTEKRESTRAETMTNVETDPTQFLTESIGSYIDNNGYLNIGPETRTVHLGSRNVEGTTTEVNLGLKTLVKFDGISDTGIQTSQVFQYVTPTRTRPDADATAVNAPSRGEASYSNHLQPSYSSANEVYGPNEGNNLATETSPLISSILDHESHTAGEHKPGVRVTSIVHRPAGPLRSGVFVPRPGVRVRVRPVVSHRPQPDELASSFDYDHVSDYLVSSPQYIPPGVDLNLQSTPVLETHYISDFASDGVRGDNEIVTEDYETVVEEVPASDGGLVPKKKLKVTVRRPPSESMSRTHTRFVLPSRFEITSKPRFYVVTRTGALGVVSNSQKPFTVKISRKLKPGATDLAGIPSTTVIYDTYTTLTTVPVIFGLETSFRNVLLTTSSPITVSYPVTPTYDADSADIMPSRTVVLTYFTTTTFTIPYVVGDQTLVTTHEETNSRVVTQTHDGFDGLTYSTITRTPSGEQVFPSIIPITSVEFGFDGPTTHILSSQPALDGDLRSSIESPPQRTPTLYDTKTFFTTYTFFTTFFAGTSPITSSSEQVVTNVITVPIKTDSPQIATSSLQGPITVFDTSETTITKTDYSTKTFYATLFSDTSSFVTPIEEIETQLKTITETHTIARTINPLDSAFIASSIPMSPSVVVSRTLYTTYTNLVTLFQGTDTVVTNLEETVSNVVTMTVPVGAVSSFDFAPTAISSTPVYTTRAVLSTQTHYLTLFNNDQSLLSSIEEVVTSYVTELATSRPDAFATYIPDMNLFTSPRIISPTLETSSEEVGTYHPELVPSIRTIYSTLTFYTTYFSDTSSIVASQEEILTSFVTLFVPPSLITAATDAVPIEPSTTSYIDPSAFVFTTTDYSTLTVYTTLFSGDETIIISSEQVVPEVITATITPSSSTQSLMETKQESVLTFLTTFTYYTTYFSGIEPVIASSESVVTQFVTIEAPPSPLTSEILITPTPVVETILGVSTASGGDISSMFMDDLRGVEVIGVSSKVATGTAVSPSFETTIQVESKVHTHVGTESEVSSPKVTTSNFNSIVDIDEITGFLTGRGASVLSSSKKILDPSENKEITSSMGESRFPITSTSVVTERTELIGSDGKITTLVPKDTLMLVTGTDGFVTKLPKSDTAVLTTPMVTSKRTEESVTSVSDIQPATVIELSDLLGGNTAFGGDIGLAIKDIVSLITGKKNKTDQELSVLTTTEKPTTQDETTTESGLTDSVSTETTLKGISEEEKIRSKEMDYPIFVLPGDILGVTDKSPEVLAPVYVPPKESDVTVSRPKEALPSKVQKTESTKSRSISTSIITGARTVFIIPTQPSSYSNEATKAVDSITPDVKSPSFLERPPKIVLDSSVISFEDSKTTVTPALTVGTSVVTGAKTIFFGAGASKSTSSPKERTLGVRLLNITSSQTSQASSAPKPLITSSKVGETVISKTTSGATTIFFPNQAPRYTVPTFPTRFITSVESITRTLALTTTRTYYTRDSTLTVPSVYTTTIPPRTFVSTIVGTRTILGILPEPSETVQIHKTIQPSERTTTITTTTLIFKSIPSTVIRTLVLPTGTHSVGSEASYTAPENNVFSAGTEKPAKPPQVADSTSLASDDSETTPDRTSQKSRDETYLRAAGPRLHDFQPNVMFEEPMLPPIVVTDQTRPEDDPFLNGRNGICDPKCQPYKKEMCKEKDGLWTCQCRPGHARKDSHDICKEIQTFVVLLRVTRMGNETVNFEDSLADTNSEQFKEFTKTAKEGISDVYRITNVRDHIYDAEVNDVMPVSALPRHEVTQNPLSEDLGVIVNFTVHVSNSVSVSLLEQELTRSLQLTDRRVGESLLLATPLTQSVKDYDECSDLGHNDCSLSATCQNILGSYTCECSEGFLDMDPTLPGRSCLAKTENCDYCHSRGDCLQNEEGKTFCRCQPMFVGRRCEINGLVLAIALPTAVAIMVVLMCIVLCCCKKCRKKKSPKTTPVGADPGSMFRGIALKGPIGGTLDRKAMIDTSSESSGEHSRKKTIPYEGYQESGDVTPYKSSKRSDLSLNRSLSTGFTAPPVMIPRARQSPNGKPMNYTVYEGQVYVW